MIKRLRYGTAAAAVLLLGTAAACAAPGGAAGARPAPTDHGSAPSSAAGGAAPQRGFTLVATGDVLPHDSVIRQGRRRRGRPGYDFRPMLAGVKPVVSGADLAICHMETVYGERRRSLHRLPVLQVAARGRRRRCKDTGYDSCSTASNHTLDDGARGVAPHPRRARQGGVAARGIGTLGRGGAPVPPCWRPAAPRSPSSRTPTARTTSRCPTASPGPSTSSTSARSSPTPAPPGRRAPTWSWSASTGARSGRPHPTRGSCSLGSEAHRLQHRRPPRHRPDPRHARARPAGVREGQRHLGRLRHGRPDRRRDDQLRGPERPARQPGLDRPASPSPLRRRKGSAGR